MHDAALTEEIIDTKAVKAPAHEVQVVNYLAATGIEIGLLLNFGASGLQVKRKHRAYRTKLKNPALIS